MHSDTDHSPRSSLHASRASQPPYTKKGERHLWGGEPAESLQHVADWGGYSGYFADPDGVLQNEPRETRTGSIQATPPIRRQGFTPQRWLVACFPQVAPPLQVLGFLGLGEVSLL